MKKLFLCFLTLTMCLFLTPSSVNANTNTDVENSTSEKEESKGTELVLSEKDVYKRQVDTPAARFKQNHRHKSKNSGSQHHTIKSKSKLYYPRMKYRSVICPIPWQFKRPQKCYHLP